MRSVEQRTRAIMAGIRTINDFVNAINAGLMPYDLGEKALIDWMKIIERNGDESSRTISVDDSL